MRNFIVVGEVRTLIAQVLLAIHSFTTANCIVVCGRQSRNLRLSRLYSEHIEADLRGKDDEAFVECVNFFAASLEDLILIPADCAGTRMINRVRKRLHAAVIPTPDSSVLAWLENKWSFYLFCEKRGLNVPPSLLAASKSDLHFARARRELGLPFVVKPVDKAASEGMHVIGSEEEFRRKILDDPDYRHAPLIVQRYIAGIDAGLDLLCLKGKVAALAVQYPVGSKVNFFSNAYLENAAHVLAQESGYDGVMNVDVRIEQHSGKVYLLESNPRFWRTLGASVWCGMNFVAESVRREAGPSRPRRLTAGSADVYYHPLFRPRQWGPALAARGRQGRMLRLMMADPYLLASSLRPAGRAVWDEVRWRLFRRRSVRVY